MHVNQPGTPTVWGDFLGSKTGEGSNPLSTGKSLYAWDAPKTHHEVWILMLKPWLAYTIPEKTLQTTARKLGWYIPTKTCTFGTWKWMFPKIMVSPNHPILIVGFSMIIFTIHFGGFKIFPQFFGETSKNEWKKFDGFFTSIWCPVSPVAGLQPGRFPGW